MGGFIGLEGVLQPDSGFDFLRVSVALLTLHVSVAAKIVRQIHVVVRSVVKPVLYQTIGKLRLVDAKFVFPDKFPLPEFYSFLT